MRIRAIGLIILSASIPETATAQPQPAGPVTGQIQMIVTCPSQVSYGPSTAGLPAGWQNAGGLGIYGFYARGLATSGPTRMLCGYGPTGMTLLGAYAPPGFPTCVVDRGSNDKFICSNGTPIVPGHTAVPVVTQHINH